MKVKPLLIATSIAASVAGFTGAANAEGFQTEIDYRSSIMTVIKWNMSAMGAMVKGEAPYDKDAFAKHASDLSAAAHLDLLAGFPEDSTDEDSDARDDIWLDWEGFEEKYAAFKQESAKLADAAARGDLEALKPRFSALGKTCKSCHDSFRN